MAYLEKLLPEFRKGAKITKKEWDKKSYIYYKNGLIYDRNNQIMYNFSAKALSYDGWELYQEPIDWDYIIKNKCLCWFWDDNRDIYVLGTLAKISDVVGQFEDFKYKWDNNGKYWKNCRPCRRGEVTFWEGAKK